MITQISLKKLSFLSCPESSRLSILFNMKFFNYILTLLVFFILSSPLLGVLLVLEKEADHPFEQELNQEQVAYIQELLITYDPRRFADDSPQLIELNDDESNSLLTYFSQNINNYGIQGLRDNVLKIELLPNTATLRGSLSLTSNILTSSFGHYVNFSAHLEKDDEQLKITEFRLANYKIPKILYNYFFKIIKPRVQSDPNFDLASLLISSITSFSLDDNYLGLSLNWESDKLRSIGEQARRLLIDSATTNLLIDNQTLLASTLAMIPESTRSISLTQLIAPLFKSALEKPGNPEKENQAIFLTLSSYLLTALDLADLLNSSDQAYPPVRKLRVTLDSRDDLPRHLIASAAIASLTDDKLANFLSILKEVEDSRSNSGFSFTDITANLIGTRMGVLATRDQSSALELQKLFSEVTSERDYFPDLGPPDGISESEFQDKYGNRTSPAYIQKLSEIESSIAALNFFQGF